MREIRTLRLTWRELETGPWGKCAPTEQSKALGWKPSTYSARASSRPYLRAGLRHEVVLVIVVLGRDAMTQPAVPSAVSYGDVQEGNDLYSASGQCTHSPPAGIETVRGRCICQHYDGDGARMDGMANPGERSINIVTENKPKVLEGLSQKGTVAGTRIPRFLVMGIYATGGQSAPNPFVCD